MGHGAKRPTFASKQIDSFHHHGGQKCDRVDGGYRGQARCANQFILEESKTNLRVKSYKPPSTSYYLVTTK